MTRFEHTRASGRLVDLEDGTWTQHDDPRSSQQLMTATANTLLGDLPARATVPPTTTRAQRSTSASPCLWARTGTRSPATVGRSSWTDAQTWHGGARSPTPGRTSPTVVDTGAQPDGFVAEWRAWCELRGSNVSQQGRKIYTMPNPVTRSAAIREVRHRLIAAGALDAGSSVISAGVGVLDMDLLEHVDSATWPRHAELVDLGWQSMGNPPGFASAKCPHPTAEPYGFRPPLECTASPGCRR
ncbi:hypothetical protein JO861_19345 [Rhodococcus hoagii]|uniref:hypothetical protein n=1 Tax=Rhodococcus hoagii TaxID=43767 RepID=UPI0019637BA4|nr:hypothetical protein [Prescottella equi]MBM9838705.1 hypothetical protein [Prescottella equi]